MAAFERDFVYKGFRTYNLDGYRCIAVDLVGHGRRPSPADLAPYSVETMAASVAVLATGMGGEPCHVVGYSMGGRVALLRGRPPSDSA